MRALIASGAGRYADPWHPFARTSLLLSRLLEDEGFDVVIDEDLDSAMASLSGLSLLVVNAGDPWRSPLREPPPPLSVQRFTEAVAGGIGILGMHSAAATMRDYPAWAAALGAVWMPQISWHPPADEAAISIVDRRFVGDNAHFTVFDERYCGLQMIGDSDIVARHHADGTSYPTAWVRSVGLSRIAVDLLGHDERSYENEGHRALLRRLSNWASSREDAREI